LGKHKNIIILKYESSEVPETRISNEQNLQIIISGFMAENPSKKTRN